MIHSEVASKQSPMFISTFEKIDPQPTRLKKPKLPTTVVGPNSAWQSTSSTPWGSVEDSKVTGAMALDMVVMAMALAAMVATTRKEEAKKVEIGKTVTVTMVVLVVVSLRLLVE